MQASWTELALAERITFRNFTYHTTSYFSFLEQTNRKLLSSKTVFLLTWVILHHSPMMTRANGSLNPDASEPIRDRAWYMCALTWKNWKGRIKHKRYENIFFCKSSRKSKKICFFSAQLKVRIYHNMFSAIVPQILRILLEVVFTTKQG